MGSPPPSFRLARGLVRFSLRSGKAVLVRVRDGPNPPPWNAVAWWDGERWRRDFGGRWMEKGTGRLFWEWFA